ncbi:hypothetical protein PENTCL1PPCAC_4112, partial [Pristionchus entomophagus]
LGCSMPPKKKNTNVASDRPRDQPSLLVAFAKQIKLQKCTVCSREIASGIYAAHFRQCRVKEDDDECQIVFTQSAEEKWATGLITLDGEEKGVRVKKEGETPATNRGHQNTHSTQRRRAKKRPIGEGGGDEGDDSGEDDSSFALHSQESKEAEETIKKREEPVRTRRSARVALQPDEAQSVDDSDPAAEAAEEEMEEGGFNLDATIREHEWVDEEEGQEEEE